MENSNHARLHWHLTPGSWSLAPPPATPGAMAATGPWRQRAQRRRALRWGGFEARQIGISGAPKSRASEILERRFLGHGHLGHLGNWSKVSFGRKTEHNEHHKYGTFLQQAISGTFDGSKQNMLEEKTVHVPEIWWSNSLFTKKTLDILWKLCGKISGPSPPKKNWTTICQITREMCWRNIEEIVEKFYQEVQA